MSGVNMFGASSHADLDGLHNIFAGGGTIMIRVFMYGWGDAGQARCFDKSDGLGTINGWAVVFNQSAGVLVFRHSFDTTNGIWTIPWAAPDNITWLFIYYDKDSDANDPRIWIEASPGNGLVVEQTVTEVIAPVGTAGDDSAFPLRIGDQSQGVNRTVDCFFADFRVYDHLLQEGAMSSIARIQGGDGIVFGLVARHVFNEISETFGGPPVTMLDYSVNKENGVVTVDGGAYGWNSWESAHRRRVG